PSLRGHGPENEEGARRQAHEGLKREERLRNRLAREGAVPPRRGPDGDDRDDEGGPGRAALAESQSRPDEQGREQGGHGASRPLEDHEARERQQNEKRRGLDPPPAHPRGVARGLPGQDQGRDDEVSDRVSEPPRPPGREESVRSNEASGQEASDADRGAGGCRQDAAEDDEPEDILEA